MRLRRLAIPLLAATLCCASPAPAAIPLIPPAPSASELGLSPAQAAEWAAIQADAQAFRQTLLDELADGLPLLAEELAASNADLPAIAQQLQSQLLYALWRSQPVRQRRMAFYLQLQPAQQAQVRSWLVQVVNGLQRVVAAADALAKP